MHSATHISDEWTFVSQIARSLPSEAHARWESCRSGHTFQAFYGKQIVAYTLIDDVPNIIKVLVCEDMTVNLRKGTASTWVDDANGDQICIGHVPVEVAPSCFMWHLQHTTLDLNEYRGNHNVKFNIAYRTLVNPKSREASRVYLLEFAAFRKQYANA